MSVQHRSYARIWWWQLCGGVFLASWLRVTHAHAVDPFEIQVYDGSANRPGVPGLELHLNTVPRGLREAEPPEVAPHRQSHFTLEPSLGIRPWWELGAYFQTALLGDGSFRYAGMKLRSKFVTPPEFDRHWRLGVNVELSRIPQAFERDRWGGEMRPILAWETERWLLVLNPILQFSFAGASASDGPGFAPALMAKVKFDDLLAVGVEYYADLGPIARPEPVRRQEQYLFEAIDLLALPDFEFNAGIGEGLTDGSNALILKAILGYSWERGRLFGG